MDRLNKFLAHAGIGSRRYCDEVIRQGRVTLDGEVVRDFSTRVSPESEIKVDGQPLQAERLVYWLVNKPKGYLCTNSDPDGRPRAIDLIPHVAQRVYTVGRLDEESEGLLLLTNDGDLAHKLMHPRFGVNKTYLVQVAGRPTQEDFQQLLDGFWLSEGRVRAKSVKRVRSQGASTWLQIVLGEGKNREIRRMLAKLEHKVLTLQRVAIGPVRLGNLKPGKSRPLGHEELARLRERADPASRAVAKGKPQKKSKTTKASNERGRPPRNSKHRPHSTKRKRRKQSQP